MRSCAPLLVSRHPWGEFYLWHRNRWCQSYFREFMKHFTDLLFSSLWCLYSHLHVHHKHTDEDKHRHEKRYTYKKKHNTVIYNSPCQQLGSKLSSTGISQVTPPSNHPVHPCTSYHIPHIIHDRKLHTFSSLSLNNTYMSVCALKLFLVAVIIPPANTGCFKIAMKKCERILKAQPNE